MFHLFNYIFQPFAGLFPPKTDIRDETIAELTEERDYLYDRLEMRHYFKPGAGGVDVKVEVEPYTIDDGIKTRDETIRNLKHDLTKAEGETEKQRVIVADQLREIETQNKKIIVYATTIKNLSDMVVAKNDEIAKLNRALSDAAAREEVLRHPPKVVKKPSMKRSKAA